MRKLLITGASGFLGWTLGASASKNWQVYGTFSSHKINIPKGKSVKLDLLDFQAVKDFFFTIKPQAVIHTAALSDPNLCQQNPQLSQRINVVASQNLAGLCADYKIPFVFTSTDLVFDGKHAPYSEQSPVSPINIYGEHKVKAETTIIDCYPKSTICRLPLMFGDPSPWSGSFLQSIIQAFRENQALSLFSDEFRTPTSCYSVSAGLLMAINLGYHLIHLGGKERISRYDFGLGVANLCGFPSTLIKSILQKSLPMSAPRPADVSLNSTKAFVKGYAPLTIKEELQRLPCLSPFF